MGRADYERNSSLWHAKWSLTLHLFHNSFFSFSLSLSLSVSSSSLVHCFHYSSHSALTRHSSDFTSVPRIRIKIMSENESNQTTEMKMHLVSFGVSVAFFFNFLLSALIYLICGCVTSWQIEWRLQLSPFQFSSLKRLLRRFPPVQWRRRVSLRPQTNCSLN